MGGKHVSRKLCLGAIYLLPEFGIGFTVVVAIGPPIMLALLDDIEFLPWKIIAQPIAAVIHPPKLTIVRGKLHADRVSEPFGEKPSVFTVQIKV